MRKINLLIPSLIAACVPAMTLTSCSTTAYYVNMSKVAESVIQFLKSRGVKERMEPETFPAYFEENIAHRSDRYMQDSTQEAIDQTRPDPSYDANRFVQWTSWADHHAIYTVTPQDGEYERVVFFLHGGGYAKNINFSHVKTSIDLADNLNAKVYVSLHPVLPQDTVEQAFPLVIEDYEKVCEEEPNKDIVLVGDSSGGGMAISLSQYLYNESFERLPVARVLYSPWVDVSLKNKAIDKYIDSDIMLHPYGLKVYGQYWVKESLHYTIDDYRVSPINGEMEDKIRTLTIVGSEEILKPDAVAFYKKLANNGCESKLIIANGLFHDFMIWATSPINYAHLPEVQEVYGMINNFLDHKPLR